MVLAALLDAELALLVPSGFRRCTDALLGDVATGLDGVPGATFVFVTHREYIMYIYIYIIPCNGTHLYKQPTCEV